MVNNLVLQELKVPYDKTNMWTHISNEVLESDNALLI